MEKDSVYQQHMLDAIILIREFVGVSTYDDFLKSKLIQSGVSRQIEIIGEAAKRVSENFKNAHADIPWKDIAGMRDKIVHDYMSIDIEEVWNVIKQDLPVLEEKLK